MTTQIFNQGIALLNKIFPKLGIEAKIYWAFLNDLDGEYFFRAIQEIVKTIPELYPGTNIIAMIRTRAEAHRLEALKVSTLKIEAETEKERIERWQKEAVSMPQDCVETLTRLGIKTGGEDEDGK